MPKMLRYVICALCCLLWVACSGTHSTDVQQAADGSSDQMALPNDQQAPPTDQSVPLDVVTPPKDSTVAPVDADASSPTDQSGADQQTPADVTTTDAQTATFKKLTIIVLGDFGTGGSGQKSVAKGIETYCASNNCDFALGVGDLIYNYGIDATKTPYDPQLDSKFLVPYANLDLVFYQVLGNHDYGTTNSPQGMIDFCKYRHGNNCSGDGSKITKFPGWFLPSLWYSFERENALFVGLDSQIAGTSTSSREKQLDWVQDVFATSKATWRIAMAHHPINSNGDHGPTTGTRGQFLRNAVCHRADIFFAGHDHHLEYLKDSCGVMLVISGGGASFRTYPYSGWDPADVQATTVIGWAQLGFAVLHIDNDTLWVTFHDKDGKQIYTTGVRTKKPPVCVADGVCEQKCASDPDCLTQDCSTNGVCNPACTEDRDCRKDSCDCDFNRNICEPSGCQTGVPCPCDPDCWSPKTHAPCAADGHCDSWCAKGTDPDCTASDKVCTP